MVVTAKMYSLAVQNAFAGAIDFENDTIMCALTTATAPDQDTDEFFDDVANEVSESGTNYTSGGAEIASPSMTYDADTNTLTFDGTDVTWSSSTITARYAIIYDAETGVAGTSPLLAYVDFGENKSSSNGDFTIQWHTDGIFKAVIS